MSVDKLLAQSEKFIEPPPPPPVEDDGRRSVTPPPTDDKKASKSEARTFDKKRLGEGKFELDKEKLERALADEKKRKQEEEEEQSGGGFRAGKKSRYNNAMASEGGDEVTEEQLGAYLAFNLPS